MNPKVFISFALGVLVASGVAYFAAKSPSTGPVASAQQQPATTAPPVVIDSTPASTKTPVASNVPPEEAPSSAAVRESAPASRPARIRSSSKPLPTPETPRVSSPPAAPPQQTASNSKTSPPVAAPPPQSSTNQPLIVQDPPPPPPPAVERESPRPAVAAKTPEPPPKPNTVTIPSGTLVNVRLQEKLSTEKNYAGDNFQATLDQPIVVDGFVIAERGARVQGRITELDRSGRVKGLARMVLELVQVNTTDGQRIRLQTSPFERKAESSTKKDAAKIGIGAAIGAAIGGIAGGGKGAATGAGVGGAAGAGGVLMTRGEAAELPVETKLSFRLQESVTVTEKLNQN